MRHTTTVISVIAVASVVAALAACGKSEVPPATATTAPATTAPATTAPATTAPATTAESDASATKPTAEPATAPADAEAGAEHDPSATDKVEAVKLSDEDLEGVELPGQTRAIIGWRDKHGTNAIVIKRESPKGSGALLVATHLTREGDASWTSVRDFKELVECHDYRLTLEAQTGAWSVSDLDGDGLGEATFAWSAGCRDDWSPVTHKVLLVESGDKYVLRGKTGGANDFKADAEFDNAPRGFRAHAEMVWQATASERPPERAAYESEAEWGSAFLGWEQLGPVPEGVSIAVLEATFGKAEKKDPIFFDEDASGQYFQTWHYPARGIQLTVTATDKALSDGSLSALHALAGSSIATRLGIHVGSSEDDMRKAYAAYANKEMTHGPYLAVGIEWTWLTFEARDGKVVSIASGLGQSPPGPDE